MMCDSSEDASERVRSAIVQGDREAFYDSIDDIDPEYELSSGNTLLHSAVWRGVEEYVSELLDRDVPIDAQNGVGKTPLHRALQEEQFEIAHLLLDNGARVDIRDAYDVEPLLHAVAEARIDLTERILERGGDPTHENQAGISPLSLARDGRSDEIVELLESHLEDGDPE